MTFRVERQRVERVKQPPDIITIKSTEGHGTWHLIEPDATELLFSLADQLGIPLCTLDGDKEGSQCCCKNCPWKGEHQYPPKGSHDKD